MAGAFLCDTVAISIKIAEIRRFRLQAAAISQECPRLKSEARFAFGSVQGKGCLMNKNDLIAALRRRTGMSKAGAGQAVDATFDAITAA